MRRFVLLFCALTLCLTLAACGGERFESYDEIIARCAELLAEPTSDDVDMTRLEGIKAIVSKPGFYDYGIIGYTVTDLSGDGIDELVIGKKNMVGDEPSGAFIYMVFTLVDGKPHKSFEEWQQFTYSSSTNNTGDIYLGFTEGADGQVGYGVYRLSSDATEMKCEEFVFFDNKTNEESRQYYLNTTGEFDISVSEELNIYEYGTFMGNIVYGSMQKNIEFTPFAE